MIGESTKPALAGQSAGPQPEQRVAGARGPAEGDLALVDDQAVLGPHVARPALAFHEAEHPALRDHLARGAYGQLDGVADPPGRHAHLAMKVIGIGVAHPARDL